MGGQDVLCAHGARYFFGAIEHGKSIRRRDRIGHADILGDTSGTRDD